MRVAECAFVIMPGSLLLGQGYYGLAGAADGAAAARGRSNSPSVQRQNEYSAPSSGVTRSRSPPASNAHVTLATTSTRFTRISLMPAAKVGSPNVPLPDALSGDVDLPSCARNETAEAFGAAIRAWPS